MHWLAFAFMTIASWGLYVNVIHIGTKEMGDPVNGRFKAFLFIGLAYFIIAVVAPIVVLVINKAEWQFTSKGIVYSTLAGMVGAIGAFCLQLALFKGGPPTSVASIIFAGAPMVNAIAAALVFNPPKNGLAAVKWQFILGVVLAAAGGYMVSAFPPK